MNTVPQNVDYACDADLGIQPIPNCEAAAQEFGGTGEVVLDLAQEPVFRRVGKSDHQCSRS